MNKSESKYFNTALKILERFHYPENERRYAINFYISGIVAVIKQWLDGECLEKTDEIAGVITKCIRPYIEAD